MPNDYPRMAMEHNFIDITFDVVGTRAYSVTLM